VEVVLPTVIALGTYAGEKPQASLLSLPAATTTATPLFTAASTASFIAEFVPLPPKLMLATAGRTPPVANQSNAEKLHDHDPLPWSDKTLMDLTCAAGATP